MNKKSVFQKISKKISKQEAVTDYDKVRRAFYNSRHFSEYRLSKLEEQLMRDWINRHGLLEKRDGLNNADYWLIGNLLHLNDERSY